MDYEQTEKHLTDRYTAAEKARLSEFYREEVANSKKIIEHIRRDLATCSPGTGAAADYTDALTMEESQLAYWSEKLQKIKDN